MLRTAPESIIVLAFNRSAAVEVRRRLRDLVGDDARGVTVLTYHAMALRLTGVSLGTLNEAAQEPNFEALIDRAVDLLEGRLQVGTDPDELRDRLLRGYRFILVDEYQDIDARQYDLVSALAGRTAKEGDTKLSILAVGDDDQNIYSFRDTSVEFIRRFAQDYHAQPTYLVENYRSTQHIISAANDIIAPAPERMKVDHPIRIDHARIKAPDGGRWEALDEFGRGHVRLIRAPADRNIQAQLAMKEIERLRSLDPQSDWSDFALLARTHGTLEPIRAWCDLHGIAYRTAERNGSGLSAVKTREGHVVLSALRKRAGRLVHSRALARWITECAKGEPNNPWWEDLKACATDLDATVGGMRVPAVEAIDWLHESAGAHARAAPGHLNVLTAHGAKGREFKHVAVLDAGDWLSSKADDRRLLYVAMTRAKETLTIFQAVRRGNPLLQGLENCEAVRAVEPKLVPLPSPDLNRLHRELALGDIDIGFAGRLPESASAHHAIARLRVCDMLTLAGRDLRDSSGCRVGRLAKNYQLPNGKILEVRVSAIVHRTKAQAGDGPWAPPRVDEWESVLCEIVVQP